MARELRRICGADYLPKQFDLDENSNIKPQPNMNQQRPATNNQNNHWVNSNTFQTLPAYPPGFQPSSNQNYLNFPKQVPIPTNWQPYIQHQQRYLSTGFSNGKHNNYFNPVLHRQMGNNLWNEELNGFKEDKRQRSNIVISWWNGGGAVRRRITTNYYLSKYLKTQCDIFAYGEALASKQRGLSLPWYYTILHPSRVSLGHFTRRGIAIFLLEKYLQKITKVYASEKFDIIWLRLPTNPAPTYVCFFYAPGDHHPESIRMEYYSVLRETFDKFSSLGKIYMMGGTNARLGSILRDRDIHGTPISNRNKPLFLGFLEYTGLKIVNKYFALGVPTYEILQRKSSIIDMCLTNEMMNVR